MVSGTCHLRSTPRYAMGKLGSTCRSQTHMCVLKLECGSEGQSGGDEPRSVVGYSFVVGLLVFALLTTGLTTDKEARLSSTRVPTFLSGPLTNRLSMRRCTHGCMAVLLASKLSATPRRAMHCGVAHPLALTKTSSPLSSINQFIRVDSGD